MVPYFLDFYENIRFSKTPSECQKQLYPTEKSTIVFLDPPKKKSVTSVGHSWNNQGIFLYSIFPEHYFGIFPGISLGIFSEYTESISRECSTNILQTYICPASSGLVRKVATFVKSSMFDV